MYQKMFNTYLKKAVLYCISLVVVLSLAFTPEETLALADPPEPYMVKDINTITTSSGPDRMTNVGGTIFFFANDSIHGNELWKSDGTESGTIMVKDIYPGSESSPRFDDSSQQITNINGVLFFGANDGTHGAEVWKSDGTEAGTTILKDIGPGVEDSYPRSFTDVNGTLFFCTLDYLWKSDGTQAGTVIVKNICGEQLTNVNGTLFFTVPAGVYGSELWKSDGTEAGTLRVKESNPEFGPLVLDDLTVVNGMLFFSAYNEVHGSELWRSDGTDAGTVMVKDIYTGIDGSSPHEFVVFGDTLFFSADDGIYATELWKSDGTEAGTVMVKDINPDIGISNPQEFAVSGDSLFFSADDGIHARELWKSDGTEAGTIMVKDINPDFGDSDPYDLIDVGGTLYFFAHDNIHGFELWKSDGSEAGTILVKDITPDNRWSPYLRFPASANGRIFYLADDYIHGAELWISDGSDVGTKLVKDIDMKNFSSQPSLFTKVNGTLFFQANDYFHGIELWKSDGTAAGTNIVKDIHLGSDDSWPEFLTDINGTLYFTAVSNHGFEIWKSDGSESGTILVTDIFGWWDDPEDLTSVDDMLFFHVDFYGYGKELWVSDGTETGTIPVKDIYPGTEGSYPIGLTDVDGTLFFSADDGVHGYELWKSDGTEAGTVMVKDINPGINRSISAEPFLVNINGTLFFCADDGVHGYELWVSDGTEPGTMLIKDIYPGVDGSFSEIPVIANINDKLFFSTDDGVHGNELWVSDGTEHGTKLFKDIHPGVESSIPWNPDMININDTLFFNADDGVHGYELWISDGTPSGTMMVKEISNSSGSFYPASLTDVNGTVYFSANDTELWSSDGTEIGTVMVNTANTDYYTGGPRELTNINGRLYFTMDDYYYGSELWALDNPNLPPTISGTQAGQQVYDTNTINPFNSVTLSDPNEDILTTTISLDNTANGTLVNLGGFVEGPPGTYTFEGNPTAATTAIHGLTFLPIENRLVPGETDTTAFKISVYDGTAVKVRDETTTVIVISVNDLPSIIGTMAGQTVDDNATIDPFASVSLSDPDINPSLTVTLSLDDPDKGELINLGGFVEGPPGSYSFTGSPTDLTTAIQGIKYDPSEGRVPVGDTETTIITISADDGFGEPVMDDTTSVIATSINDPPTISGTVAGQTVDDNDTINTFTGVTIADPDKDTSLTVILSMDDPDKGDLTNLGGFIEGPPGTYTFVGSPINSTAAIQSLTFIPIPDRVPIGQTETTTFTISADDGIAAPAIDENTTAIVTAVGPDNTPPSISGTQSGQEVDDNNTIKPFTTATISDPDEDASLVVKIKVEDDDTGELTNLGGFVKVDDDTYKFTGSPSAATKAIRNLSFLPKENRLKPGDTEKTTFIIRADDGIAEPVVDKDTTVIVTSINDKPTISGTIAGQTIDDNDTITPFGKVVIADPDKKASLTVIVQMDDNHKGELKNLNGFVEGPDGTYTFLGNPTAATSAIQGLKFVPMENRRKPGNKETAAFSIYADDGIADPVMDDTTTVIVTSINDAPTISGTQAGQVVAEGATIDPFAGVSIIDPDKKAILTVTVSMDNPDTGELTNLGGFVEGPNGIYTFMGSPAEATTALKGLTFVPMEGRVPPGQSETTKFTISADDGIAKPVVDDNTTVIVRMVVITNQLFMPLILR